MCPASLQELDLTGSRDFLDAETARQVLAPLLAANAAHRQVCFSHNSRLFNLTLGPCGLKPAMLQLRSSRAAVGVLLYATLECLGAVVQWCHHNLVFITGEP